MSNYKVATFGSTCPIFYLYLKNYNLTFNKCTTNQCLRAMVKESMNRKFLLDGCIGNHECTITLFNKNTLYF